VIATKGRSYRMRRKGTTEEKAVEDDGAGSPKVARKA
jgi:hypothetical protein